MFNLRDHTHMAIQNSFLRPDTDNMETANTLENIKYDNNSQNTYNKQLGNEKGVAYRKATFWFPCLEMTIWKKHIQQV